MDFKNSYVINDCYTNLIEEVKNEYKQKGYNVYESKDEVFHLIMKEHYAEYGIGEFMIWWGEKDDETVNLSLITMERCKTNLQTQQNKLN